MTGLYSLLRLNPSTTYHKTARLSSSTRSPRIGARIGLARDFAKYSIDWKERPCL
jgi:hypothetical protein